MADGTPRFAMFTENIRAWLQDAVMAHNLRVGLPENLLHNFTPQSERFPALKWHNICIAFREFWSFIPVVCSIVLVGDLTRVDTLPMIVLGNTSVSVVLHTYINFI